MVLYNNTTSTEQNTRSMRLNVRADTAASSFAVRSTVLQVQHAKYIQMVIGSIEYLGGEGAPVAER